MMPVECRRSESHKHGILSSPIIRLWPFNGFHTLKSHEQKHVYNIKFGPVVVSTGRLGDGFRSPNLAREPRIMLTTPNSYINHILVDRYFSPSSVILNSEIYVEQLK